MAAQRGKRGALHASVKARPSSTMMADINVTPLVDVVLVLLIIFMVVTPMLSRGVDVQLPIAANHEKKNDTGDQIVISLTHTGGVFYDTKRVDDDRLKSNIEDELRRNPSKEIFFKADKRVKYGQAREVLEKINKAGAQVVQLGTDEVKKE